MDREMIKITRIKPSRWKEYKDLRIESIKNSPQAFLSDLQETLNSSDSSWQKKIKNMFFAVNEKDQLVGMVGCLREKKNQQDHIMKIVSLYVTPKFRGQGLGRKLLKKALKFAQENKNITKIELGVITKQKAAIKLYQSSGFVEIGIQKRALKIDENYYDESLMELYLN